MQRELTAITWEREVPNKMFYLFCNWSFERYNFNHSNGMIYERKHEEKSRSNLIQNRLIMRLIRAS